MKSSLYSNLFLLTSFIKSKIQSLGLRMDYSPVDLTYRHTTVLGSDEYYKANSISIK